MKRERFEALSAKAEVLSERNPSAYKAYLVVMALGAYAYILLILLVLLVLLGLLVYLMMHSRKLHAGVLQIGFGLLVVIWCIVRALWVRVPPPDGLRLTVENAPELIKEVEKIRTAVGAPPVKEVVMDLSFNASVMQVPLLGILGWHRNYLTIGLPLMLSLSADQLRAVLAHEFGHLSGAHGKFAVWTYRLRASWERVIQSFSESGSKMTFVFLPFYKWFAPRFVAYSMVIGRKQEFEADRMAGAVAGSEVMVNALVRTAVYGEYLDSSFWRKLFRRAEAESKAPAAVQEMIADLEGQRSPEDASFKVGRALAEVQEGYDTHPTLGARIASLRGGGEPAGADEVERITADALAAAPDAARVLLGSAFDKVVAALGDNWQRDVAPVWEARHKELAEERTQLAELETRAAAGVLSQADQWKRAALVEDLEGGLKALPFYQAILNGKPDSHEAAFAVGRLLLEQKDQSGEDFVKRVMAEIPDSRPAGCQLLAKFHYELGNVDEARRWRMSADDEYEDAVNLEQEKGVLVAGDKLLPHTLDSSEVAELRKQIEDLKIAGSVYYIRKQLRQAKDQTCDMVVITRKCSWWRMADSPGEQKKDQDLFEQVMKAVHFRPDVRVFFVRDKSLIKRVSRVANAAIFVTQ